MYVCPYSIQASRSIRQKFIEYVFKISHGHMNIAIMDNFLYYCNLIESTYQ